MGIKKIARDHQDVVYYKLLVTVMNTELYWAVAEVTRQTYLLNHSYSLQVL